MTEKHYCVRNVSFYEEDVGPMEPVKLPAGARAGQETFWLKLSYPELWKMEESLCHHVAKAGLDLGQKRIEGNKP